MNSPDPEDSRLTGLLLPPPLPDDGFSARVLAALPAPVPSSRVSPRLWCCLGGTVAGLAVAWSGAGSWSDLLGGWTRVECSVTALLAPLADPMLAVAAVAAALSLLFAFKSGPDRRASI